MTSIPHGLQLRSIHRQLPFTTTRVVVALILREMATTYGRKPGGYVWTILEPVAGIAIMSWLFMTVGLRHPSLGTNFPIFYATGLLPFFVFTNVSQRVAQSLRYSSRLLAYPRVTVLDALLARYILNLLTQFLVAYIVIAGVLIFQDTGTQLVLSHIVLGFAMAGALAAGIGLLNCFLTSMFTVWGTFWSLITRPLVFLSGVMILVEELPEAFRAYLLWNPIVHVVAEVRSGFFHGYDPPYISPAYVFGVSLVSGVLGLLLLWRFHRDILEN
ncbi:MAG TPA: ABC transporter permease [Rubellimicrobium sp.]|jgi:capsular polysaccharide transport system permease protein|nr:ABC transporter permease [Rubellimicrobium sp.]